MGTQAPWYTFNRIDNFGQIDPQKGADGSTYYKPDSNILTPPGYPVTALLSGTVTSIRRTDFGQTVVTIKLDSPLNSLATHTFYEHMHDSAGIWVGQHVSAGDLIGHANYSGEGANLGFGLYSGDVYGSGPAWTMLQQDLAPGGPGLLNPTKLLDAFKNGNSSGVSLADLFSGGSSSGGINIPGIGNIDIPGMIQSFQKAVQLFLEKAALVALALLLVGFGLYIAFKPQIDESVQKAASAAKTGAEVAAAA